LWPNVKRQPRPHAHRTPGTIVCPERSPTTTTLNRAACGRRLDAVLGAFEFF